MSHIHAICLVKNEGDVISQTLQFASKFCHKIYVFDTGSTDDSWEQIKKSASQVVVPFRHEAVPFYDGLRAQVFNAVRDRFESGDWLYILDADEFLAADPRQAIRIAEQEGAQQINTIQYNFHFTELDWQKYQKGLDSRDTSIRERRRYYRFTNFEQRLFRIDADLTWSETVDADNPHGAMIPRGHYRSERYRQAISFFWRAFQSYPRFCLTKAHLKVLVKSLLYLWLGTQRSAQFKNVAQILLDSPEEWRIRQSRRLISSL